MWRGFGQQQVAPAPPAPPATFADRFSADFQSTAYTELGRVSRMLSEGDAYQEQIDKIYGITGRKLENPGYLADGVAIANAEKALDEGWLQARQRDSTLGQRPDARARAIEIAKQKAAGSMEMAQGSVGFGGAAGGFLGATAATMLHPIQLAMLPFGGAAKTGGWAANILREGVEQALIGGAVQVPIEIEAAPWRQRVGIEQSSLANIGQAAAGGLVLGAGFRAIGEAGRALLARRPAAPGYTGQTWWPAVEQAARQAGVNPEYMAKTAMVESSGMNVRPKGPGQTASGLFGFTDGTWRNLGANLADKGDIAKQAEVMSNFTAVNRRLLREKLGREPTDLELYAAHHFDPTIAARMAEGPDSTLMIDLVGQRAVEANPYLSGMTVGRWKERFAKKFGDEYAPRGRRVPQDEQDLFRTVDRAARDVDDAHGPPAAATAHMANMREAERSVIDGLAPKIEPLPESPELRRIAAPSGREADVQHELVELSSIWDDGPTGKADRPVIGPDNKVEAGGDAVAALRGGDAQAQARQVEMARELGLDQAGYVQPVVVDRRVRNMGEAERAQWVNDWREPPAPASEMARGLSGPDRADLAVAEAIARRADEQGVSIGALLADGEPVTPGALRFLRAMSQDDALRFRADPAAVPARIRAAARARGEGSRGPALEVGEAQPPLIERAIQAATEQTEQALKPEAVKAVEMDARRQIADAITTRPDIGEQKVDIGDGRQIALDDVDAELSRLERMDEASKVIEAACLGLRVIKAAAE